MHDQLSTAPTIGSHPLYIPSIYYCTVSDLGFSLVVFSQTWSGCSDRVISPTLSGHLSATPRPSASTRTRLQTARTEHFTSNGKNTAWSRWGNSFASDLNRVLADASQSRRRRWQCPSLRCIVTTSVMSLTLRLTGFGESRVPNAAVYFHFLNW